MDPRDFHKLATELVAGVTPAKIRTAINRAYYAAHHVGAELLKGMGFKIEKGSQCHAGVYHRLNNCGDKEIIKAGSQLGDLQSERNKADYRLDNKDIEDQKTAQMAVEQSRRIIQTLDGCRGEVKIAQIKKEIQEWERKVGKI
jgi:uncharacterized protein (UPF0332 family)